jgi:rubredoxin
MPTITKPSSTKSKLPLKSRPYQHNLTKENIMSNADFKSFICIVCGFVYDEAAGRPEDGIAAGTKWADVPEDWACPDCGVAKADFEAVEF